MFCDYLKNFKQSITDLKKKKDFFFYFKRENNLSLKIREFFFGLVKIHFTEWDDRKFDLKKLLRKWWVLRRLRSQQQPGLLEESFLCPRKCSDLKPKQ